MRLPCSFSFAFIGLFGMVFIGGCGKKPSGPPPVGFHRQLTEDEQKKRDQLKKDSDEMERKMTEEHFKSLGKANSSGGTLAVGDKTLDFSEVTLWLAPTSADASSTVQPQLLGKVAGASALTISPLLIESANDAKQVAGQTITVNSSTNMVAEIIMADGWKGTLGNTIINFTKSDKNLLFFTLEGEATDASGQQTDKLKVTGELRATVKSGEESK